MSITKRGKVIIDLETKEILIRDFVADLPNSTIDDFEKEVINECLKILKFSLGVEENK